MIRTRPQHRPATVILAFYILMAVAFILLCVFMVMLSLSFSRRRSQPGKDPNQPKKE